MKSIILILFYKSAIRPLATLLFVSNPLKSIRNDLQILQNAFNLGLLQLVSQSA
jgi:hypothetical protein